MNDASGLAEAMLGLDGLRVLDVVESLSEVVVTVETTPNGPLASPSADVAILPAVGLNPRWRRVSRLHNVVAK